MFASVIQSDSDIEPRIATMSASLSWSVTRANGVWQTPFWNDDVWRSLTDVPDDARNAAVFCHKMPSPYTSRVLQEKQRNHLETNYKILLHILGQILLHFLLNKIENWILN